METELKEQARESSVSQGYLDKERTETILVRQLYQESFYGILGTHPKATREDIENGFRERITKLQEAGKRITQDGQLAIVLKAYATLTSGYKNNYDEYLKNYENGLMKAVELLSSDKECLDEFVKAMQPWSTGMQPWATGSKDEFVKAMQPWSTGMQPWATGSKKILMQPWATGK